MEEKIKKALELIDEYGGVDGAHHKQWLLDQIVRTLCDSYENWVKNYNREEMGEWDIGIAP